MCLKCSDKWICSILVYILCNPCKIIIYNLQLMSQYHNSDFFFSGISSFVFTKDGQGFLPSLPIWDFASVPEPTPSNYASLCTGVEGWHETTRTWTNWRDNRVGYDYSNNRVSMEYFVFKSDNDSCAFLFKIN